MNDKTLQAIIDRLLNDEVVTVTANRMRALYDYMEANEIDPDDYRQSGDEIWIA